ncbi:MAG: hypothetical protein AVDCRST_MAG17-1271, partial [uncultured Solirubrobacterales bacterium]
GTPVGAATCAARVSRCDRRPRLSRSPRVRLRASPASAEPDQAVEASRRVL